MSKNIKCDNQNITKKIQTKLPQKLNQIDTGDNNL